MFCKWYWFFSNSVSIPLSHRFIVSSRGSSGRLGGGGGGGRKVLWHLILIFRSPSSSSHYIVGLITGGLELVWISGVISMVEETAQCVSLGETYA